MAVAIHHGHTVRKVVAKFLALTEEQRSREEDPFTGIWTAIADTQVVVHRSRFEVDLNRPRMKAVYIEPEDAWGLRIWKSTPPPEILERLLEEYDAFYAEIQRIFTNLKRRFGRFAVFDLHTYNHSRTGLDFPLTDTLWNPEVNIGTGTMNRCHWAPLVSHFIADLRSFSFLGRQLDVRENIKFSGGQFAQWVHCNFSESACVLSIEFKKFFMDEWTGEPDPAQLKTIGRALQSTVPGILEELREK